MVIGHVKAHKATQYGHLYLCWLCICSYIHKVIGHMKAHKAINTTYVPLLTMHMFLYPHGDRSYEST